jgi:transposase
VRDDDGRKLDHATLEAIRIRSVKQIEAGARVEEVAAGLGLNRSTVFGWVASYREGGERALRSKPVPGRPPRLSAAQLRTLYTLIVGNDPRQYEFDFALWTRELVRELIWKKFQVRLSAVSVGRLLGTLGLSPQRPVFRASQQDSERVRRWRETDYPAIRDEAAQLGATIYVADEAGVRSDYHSGTTWAPVGQTPVVSSTGPATR